MKPKKIRTRTLYLALTCGLLPIQLGAATPDPETLEALDALLSERYYEVEFFVFERPAVLDFATEEILTLDRPRALPKAIRTQRLAPEELWREPLDPLTRACLTFPILSYELLPPAETLTESPSAADAPDAGDLPAPVPTPQIEPILEPDPHLDFLAKVAEFERTLQAGSQRWQPPENFRLQRAANRISRRGLGRIVFHGRWLQVVPAREAPDPILVQGGEQLSPPFPSHELIGSVGVTLGRYLHFKADLFFHGPGLGLEPAVAAMDASGEGLLLESERMVSTAGYMQLSESRRMRSEELHYLDHPKLGVVVRIDPVSFPEALLEQFEQLRLSEAAEVLEEGAD